MGRKRGSIYMNHIEKIAVIIIVATNLFIQDARSRESVSKLKGNGFGR